MHCLYYTVFYCKDCDCQFSVNDPELYRLVDEAPQERSCLTCGRMCADIDRHMDLVEEPDITFKEAPLSILKRIFRR